MSKMPEWKVFYDGNYWGHSGRDHAGIEIAIGKQFAWAGQQWIIPAVYSCSRGLVIEFCMQVESEQIQQFMNKWDLDEESDNYWQYTQEERMQIDRDNPLHLDFSVNAVLNGVELSWEHGSSEIYNPCLPEGFANDWNAMRVMDHYALDKKHGWVFWRWSFPWKTRRRPKLRTLSIRMEQQLVDVPGPHFRVAAPGDTFCFTHPQTGVQHTLTVQEYEQQKLDLSNMRQDQECPSCSVVMSYIITPEIDDKVFSVTDCVESDQPRQKRTNPNGPEAVDGLCAVSVIGRADGPTSIFLAGSISGRSGQEHLRTACSALHFEPMDDVEWRMVFHETQFEPVEVELIGDF